jgi:class 3 adenylate cyclase/pimeloyl-ACP methyl ester carboxylesterase
MDPRIQYTTTSDGMRIAFWTMGSGPPLVMLRPEPSSHIVNELTVPELRGFYERLTEDRTLVRYDSRGCGLSTRETEDGSYESLIPDLLAVIDALGYEKVDVLAIAPMAPLAVLMGARHPERLGRLAVLGSNQFGSTKISAFRRALEPLREEYYEDYQQINHHLIVGWENSGLASRLARAYQDSTTPAHFSRIRERHLAFDYEPLAPLVRAPTLIVGRLETGAHGGPAMIPGAQIAPVARDSMSYLVDWEPHVAAITQFLDEAGAERPARGAAAAALPHGTAIILFTDIVDSTALTERLGDAAFRKQARDLGGALRTLIRECAGTPVEGPTLGDGVLAVFTSAREAIEAAQRCGKAGDDAGLPLHLGLHAGDVTREQDPDGRDNVYGGAVNIASRISALSAAGEVLVSETVRSLARTSAGVTFEDRGEQQMKGVGEAVRVWAVKGDQE